MKGLIIYPNFSYNNPNQIQLNRLISGLGDKCEIHVLARKGPRTPSTLAKVFYIPKENFFRVRPAGMNDFIYYISVSVKIQFLFFLAQLQVASFKLQAAPAGFVLILFSRNMLFLISAAFYA